jgi:hypothetical protein
MFKSIDSFDNRVKKYHKTYVLDLLQYLFISSKTDVYHRYKFLYQRSKIITKISFHSKSQKPKNISQNRVAISILLPSVINFLDNKISNIKKSIWNQLSDFSRALKFSQLIKNFTDKTCFQPKRDLVDMFKADFAYMDSQGASNCYLFRLLRKYWIRQVCVSMLAPSRIYKILYLIKMVMMHKTISYQRYIREFVRKWRFSAFVQNISRRKLELMYKNLHVSYLQIANELFGDKGIKNPSLVKEFERLANKMGTFKNEDYDYIYEDNFCNKINKKYIFHKIPLIYDKEGNTFGNFASGIELEDSGENNQDYYVDRDLPGETIGKYRQDTNKSSSRMDKSSSRY